MFANDKKFSKTANYLAITAYQGFNAKLLYLLCNYEVTIILCERFRPVSTLTQPLTTLVCVPEYVWGLASTTSNSWNLSYDPKDIGAIDNQLNKYNMQI